MPIERTLQPQTFGTIRLLKQTVGVLQERLRRPDLYVVSYPKSGRTWIELMVARFYQLRFGIPYDRMLSYRSGPLYAANGCRVPTIRFGHGHRYQHFCQGKRFPVWFYRNARVALLIRDPRDVAVSYYHYQRFQLKSFQGSLDEFVRHRSPSQSSAGHASRCGIAPILRYTNAWSRSSDTFQAFRTIRYEDFHIDAVAQLKQLLAFAGLQSTDEEIEDAVQFASFQNMRQLEQSGNLRWHGLPGGNDSRGFKTRSGKVGGYRSELSPETQSWLNEQIDQSDLEPMTWYLRPSRNVA